MLAHALLALLLPGFARAEPAKLDELAPHASGIALVEVVEAKAYDQRPADGNAGVEFKFKLIRGSGEFRDSVHVITEYGGLRPPGSKPPPSVPLRAESLKKGARYWIAFASEPMSLTSDYNQGIIAAWPEKEPKVAEVLETAVKNDVLRWQPQYDPDTHLTYGHLSAEKHWLARVEKDDKLLWEREIPGKKTDGYFAWGLWDNTGNDFPSKMPPCKKLLVALTSTELPKDNEYGLPAGRYYVNTGYDPESGKRYAAWVSLAQTSSVELVHREYVPDSGKVKREDRFEFPKTGGKAVGAKTEAWYKKTSRVFDIATGKVTTEEVFRHDQDAEPDKRWVKIGK